MPKYGYNPDEHYETKLTLIDKDGFQKEGNTEDIISDYNELREEIENRGIPSGGESGQMLTKASNDDYDVEWSDIPSFTENVETTVANAANTWLQTNIINPSNPPLDSSLSLSNAAAPADKVGELKSAINEISEVVNLFDIKEETVNGVTATRIIDGVVFNGTATDANAYFELGTLPAGTYTAKLEIVSGTISTASAFSLRYETGSGTRWLNNGNTLVTVTFENSTRIFIAITNGVTVSDYKVRIQINKGTSVDAVYNQNQTAKDIIIRKTVEDFENYVSDVLSEIASEGNLLALSDEEVDDLVLTVKSNGDYEIDGTAGSATPFTGFILPPGTYKASITVVSGTTTGALSIRYGTGSGTLWTTGEETSHTFTEETYVFLRANAGTYTDYIVSACIDDERTGITAVDKVVRKQIANIYTPANELLRYSVNTCVNKHAVSITSETTILAFGDSITHGSVSKNRNPWTYYLAEILGCTVINNSVSGALFGESVRTENYWISKQIADTTELQWSSADIVIIAAGTNDAGYNTTMSELKAKVQAAITAIRAKTNVPILIITPIRRGANDTDANLLKLPYIAGIIENVGLFNQCSIINGFDFPIPSFDNGEIDAMTDDNMHPNNTGAYVYAISVINAVM